MSTKSSTSIAAAHDITCKRGDNFLMLFKYWQDDAKTIPLDISAASFKMDVVNTKKQSTVLNFATGGSGMTIANTNELTLTKTAVQMQVEAGVYVYDLQKTVSGVVQTIMKGSFTIENDVTQ